MTPLRMEEVKVICTFTEPRSLLMLCASHAVKIPTPLRLQRSRPLLSYKAESDPPK
jgi:hypothetical protein